MGDLERWCRDFVASEGEPPRFAPHVLAQELASTTQELASLVDAGLLILIVDD